jgi:hypothetical protein
MGRTIPTSTDNLRREKQDWKAFQEQLPKADRLINVNAVCKKFNKAHRDRLTQTFAVAVPEL